MKWREFKRSVEDQGINDDTDITWIDWDATNADGPVVDGDEHSAHIE